MQGPQLGAAIKARLDRLGWSQHGLVRRVNKTGITTISAGYLSQLIHGEVQSVGSDKLQAFAAVFGVTVDQLLDAGDATPPRTDLPTEGLHPSVVAVAKRFGKYLNDRDWDRVAGFL